MNIIGYAWCTYVAQVQFMIGNYESLCRVKNSIRNKQNNYNITNDA